MHAWIFRHRKRLSAVFGMVTGEAPLADESARGNGRERRAGAEPSEADRGDAPADEAQPADAPNNRLGIPPGTVARRERYVVLAPMPRRVA